MGVDVRFQDGHAIVRSVGVSKVDGVIILLLMLGMVVLGTAGQGIAKRADHYRGNAMDLCAWHARTIFDDDPNDPNQRWVRVRSGELTCPFCGQKHDRNWISRNAWDSQVNAMLVEERDE